jgi:L-iditol 2-dehydrogenase
MFKMNAAVLKSPGEFVVEKIRIPEFSDNEVLVKVMAAGVCGSDLDRIMHTGMYHMPAVPGHEFCGRIFSTGRSVRGFKPGDKVAVAPLMPCYACDNCKQGFYGQCDHYDYIGSRRDGAFAEYVAVPEANLIPMPKNVGYLEGAAIEPAAVTLHGMQKARIDPGDLVAVLGCGALGLFAVQFAKLMGAGTVVAADVAESKFLPAKKAGADVTVDAKKGDTVRQMEVLFGNKMPDVVVEAAGSSITQEQSIRLAKKQGRILFLGSSHRDVVFPPASFEKVIRNELTMYGSWNSYSAPFPGREWSAVLRYLSDGRFNIRDFITHKITLDELPAIIKKMYDREFEYNKVVVTFEKEGV